MNKMMTISLPSDVVDTLRDLAGGPRKIGGFLAGAIPFLAANAEVIRAHKWNELVIVTQLAWSEELEETYRMLKQSIKEQNERLMALEQARALEVETAK